MAEKEGLLFLCNVRLLAVDRSSTRYRVIEHPETASVKEKKRGEFDSNSAPGDSAKKAGQSCARKMGWGAKVISGKKSFDFGTRVITCYDGMQKVLNRVIMS